MVRIEPTTEDITAFSPAFAELLEALPDAVVVATTDGRIAAVNSNLCALARYSSEAIIGRSIDLLVPRGVRARHAALRAAYVADGTATRSMESRPDLVLLCSDGFEVPVDVALSSVRFEDRDLVVATVRDASSRRHAELRAERERLFLSAMNAVSNALQDDTTGDAALRVATERARRVLDGDLAILALPDPDDENSLVVRAADGVSAAGLLEIRYRMDQSRIKHSTGQDDITLFVGGHDKAARPYPRQWPAGMGSTLIVPLHDRDKTVGVITVGKLSGRPAFEASDIALVRVFAAHTTLAITSARTRAAVERSRRLEAAAEQSASNLEREREVVEKLEELAREKSDFVSRVSHELRTPLASIIGYGEILADGEAGPTTPEQEKMLAIVKRNAARLLGLIEDLLLISTVESGDFVLELRHVDLEQVVASVVESCGPALASSRIELKVDLGSDTWLTADRDQLEQVVLNLVSNAVKFTPPLGRIAIDSETRGAEIAIAVRDTGIGIPADELSHLFTRFFRTARARTEEIPGTGLGLSIVKDIVARHQGTIDVQSTPAGTTFTIRLPIDGPKGDSSS
jgi:PAS domain S-box-containing protein